MLNSEELIIGDRRYCTQQYAAMRSFHLLAELVKVVGPALGALSGASADTDVAKLAPVLAAGLAGVDPNEASRLVLKILEGTQAYVDGARIELKNNAAIDRVFSGRMGELFKVIAHAVKVNYGDFFAGADPTGSEPAATLAS